MGSIGEPPTELDYEVLVIGAGLSGIFTLYRMQQFGIKTIALEAASGEGGTWFWNRYPGVQFDSESVSYGFSEMSQEVLDEWNWTETFAHGDETLRYAQFLTDKFNLRQYMQFNTRVKSARWREESNSWLVTDQSGRTYSTRFIITALGILNEPTLPNIPGIEDYRGEAFHTSRWPREWTFKDKRVGIIGTGATAIQIIQEIVKPQYGMKSLTVFQRTPNWSAPLRNEPISSDEMKVYRDKYPEIFDQCSKSYAGFLHVADTRKTLEVPEDERLAFWEQLYAKPGFAKWLGNFADINTDRDANAAFSAFIAQKIRARVHDPVTAEKLIPKTHGFGTRRVPLETHYFEAYNQENVRLVDVAHEAPIQRITHTGILLQSGEHIDLDALIYATGFDAVTGPMTAIEWQGVHNTQLPEIWSQGPRTYLGLFVHRLPNMMMILGPHQAFGNIPRSIQFAGTWVSEFVRFCKERHLTRVECRAEKVEEWTQHVWDCAKGLLMNEVDSWMTGVNRNVKGKQKRIVARYSGSGPGYRRRCLDVAENGYRDLDLE
ncbi:uncharacterized protein MYCFIDRAFT_189534 [Pseudocercospora fijiensis CIRAD86]|uniref:FAD/NAD(P)-binding domain-containing protein n=1 Tax=Pseudocercospora fijiensis (strain CIRAD86) TaxID=383855 RepID=M3AV83_PSEFD|nr:uncharacterized protein MYCFIDRAFT_189534 [Pseudocercospora fijiensis CIRAD86]EME81392.1 hypothetical protein MYCFIDRAFT_189534 [Pseudocercospora fijiensis CIRAD86]